MCETREMIHIHTSGRGISAMELLYDTVVTMTPTGDGPCS